MNEENTLKLDRMRYAKNTFSSNFAILAILFDVIFFVSLYETDVGTYYYNILIGVSIIYNLVFMLAAFLASEGVKNYDIKYCYLMLALGVGQLIRVGIYPMQAHSAVVMVQDVPQPAMGDAQFILLVCCLLLSAACLFVGAVAGIQKSRALSGHLASLAQQAA